MILLLENNKTTVTIEASLRNLDYEIHDLTSRGTTLAEPNIQIMAYISTRNTCKK